MSRLMLRKLIAFILIYIYTLVLWYVYTYIIQPLFAYQGFRYYPPTALEWLILSLFVTLPALMVPQSLTNISAYFYFLSYFFIYIPTLLMFSFYYPDLSKLQILFFIELLIAQFIVASFVYIPIIKVSFPRLGRLTGLGIFLVVGVVIFGFLISKFGLKPPPSPFDPYDTRLAAREFGSLVGYALRTASNVIASSLMLFGLLTKSIRGKILLWVGILLFILVYSFDGTKSTLLAPMLIFAIFYIYKKRVPIEIVLGTLILLIGVGTLIDLYIRIPVFSSFLVRRLMLTPGFLSVLYYEYFIQSQNPIFLYSHSFMGFFFENPYSTSPAFLIGYTYFSSETVSANANLYADAVANLGFWGIPVIALTASLYLYLLRSISGGCEGVALLFTSVSVFALVNTSFFTTLLTHGLLLSGLLVALLPRGYLQLVCPSYNGNVASSNTSVKGSIKSV